MKKEFDEILKSKLQNFEAAPPKGTFAAIQKKMKAPEKEIKATGFVWPPLLKYGLAASIAFVMGLATMNIIGNQNQSNTNLVSALEQTAFTAILNGSETQETALTETVAVSEATTTNISPAKSPSVETILNESVLATKEATPSSKNQVVVSEDYTVKSKVNIVINPNAANPVEKEELKIFTQQQNKVVIDVEGVYAATQMQESEDIKVYALYSLENELEEEEIELAKIEDEPTISRFESNTSSLGYTGFWFGPNLSGNHQIIGGKNIFGLGLGFDFGYDFKPNFGIQSAMLFKMMIKDVKTITEQGNPQHELIDFSNISIPLSLKWKKSYFANNIKRPVSFNAYLGADYARLTKLNKNQIGAHIGVEYDLFLKPEMMFTVGIRSGLANILDYTPSQEFLQSNYKKINYALSIYTSLRFISPKKSK